MVAPDTRHRQIEATLQAEGGIVDHFWAWRVVSRCLYNSRTNLLTCCSVCVISILRLVLVHHFAHEGKVTGDYV